ncbi:MAG: aldose epimerase family protein [Oscillospiraceae bacterium]|nr:aldose epimerase family protein [Oscillospiraceae bacterium]
MLTKTSFGQTKNGESVSLYRLTNGSGAYAEILDYGCTVRSIVVPARTGMMTDVCLGYDTLADYEADDAYMGAAVGRFANRISGARFTLNGETYALAANDGPNCLHGGGTGFDRRVWEAVRCDENAVTFRRVSPAGEEGFPGTLTAEIRYTFTDDNELVIQYAADTDADTPLNLTNHTYFNLDGLQSDDALEHLLSVRSAFITEQGAGLLPTGRLLAVDEDLFDMHNDTPFDFNSAKAVGRDIALDSEQLRIAGGYDHNFVLDGAGYREAASLYSPESGIELLIFTDAPCVQFYSGNFLRGRIGKGGRAHRKNAGVCLETGAFPDAVNRPEFPTAILKKGERFYSKTACIFSTEVR